jgi:hypothetical protein
VFPAHKTNLFQFPDLSFFGILKTKIETTHGDFNDHSIKDQITKLLQAFQQSATSFNIRGSFCKGGFDIDGNRTLYTLVFQENVVRKNAGFTEFWDRNISVNDLPSRRRNFLFGIINKHYFHSCET